MTRFAHALLSATFQNNISSSHAQYAQCVRVTVERTVQRTMFSEREVRAMPSYCIHQAIRTEPKQLLWNADAK
jgi:hypothetical protein